MLNKIATNSTFTATLHQPQQLFSQLKNHEYVLTLPYTRITYELLPFIVDIDLNSWTTISLFDNLEEPKVM